MIPEDFAEDFRKIGGFRNRIAHMYWRVISGELYEVIRKYTGELTKFTKGL